MIGCVANAAWLAGCLPEAARYRRATARVRLEQELLLRALLRRNAGTEFGRRFGFAGIRSMAEYQSRVPVSDDADVAPWIDRVAGGASNVLTHEPVRLFEPTSGSAGPVKLVPVTRTLQRQFQRAIRAWIADLFLHTPSLMDGQAYWSVSPAAVRARRTAGGVPIGFDDDAAYVGGWQRRLVDAVRVAPGALSPDDSFHELRYKTLLALVRAPRLRLISIWNPTFLSLIVDGLPEHGDRLAGDLRHHPARLGALRAALAAPDAAERHRRLWPALALISCWTDANAGPAADQLAARFPAVRLQGKGLIATEAFVSLPLTGRTGGALAVRSHVLEFAPIDVEDAPGDALLPADRIEEGRAYEVIVSTGGGLYRYRLGDVVEVVGRVRDCPMVRFVGRRRAVSDWFGEKLHDAHVGAAVRAALAQTGLAVSFAMVACDTALVPPAYVLYVESPGADERLESTAVIVERELRRNFHYDYARRLGQLGPLRVFRASGAQETYLAEAVGAGRRAGDVKPLALDRGHRWSSLFTGRFVAQSSATF